MNNRSVADMEGNDFINDEFLDKFQIPKGTLSQREYNFFQLSKKVYDCLEAIVGDAHIVDFRRKMIEEQFIFNIPKTCSEVVFSGSKSEGLDLSGSDTDIMFVNALATEINTRENEFNIPQKDQPIYIYDTLNTKRPGYPVVLKKHTSGYGVYSQLDFKRDVNKRDDDSLEVYHHGPSFTITIADNDIDIVKCFKTNDWPIVAQEWIQRQRPYNWPQNDVIGRIRTSGCHLVPVGESQESAEWRLSFSVAEKNLVHAFNHLQLLTYAAMKIILKEHIKTHLGVSNILCSYFLKTTLFWICEETPRELWVEKNFLICLHICLTRLKDYVFKENCPNYFVPTNNMLTGRFENPRQKTKLLSILSVVLEDGLKWVNESTTFADFRKYLSRSSNGNELQSYKDRKFAVEHISLVTSFIGHKKSYFNFLPLNEWRQHKIWIKKLIRFDQLKWTIIEILFGKVIRRCSQRKVVYRLEKLRKVIMVKGLKEDPTQLVETYATWLYSHGKYDECLAVTKHALESGYQWLVYQRLVDFQMFDNSQSANNDPEELVDKFHVFTLTDVLINVTDDSSLPELFYLFEAFKASFLMRQLLSHLNLASSKVRKEIILSLYPEMHCRVLRSFCYLRIGDKLNAKEETEAIKRNSIFRSKPNYPIYSLYHFVFKTFLSLMCEYYEKHENYSSSAFQTFLAGAMDFACLNMVSSNLDPETMLDFEFRLQSKAQFPEDVDSILRTSCTTHPF